MIDYDDDELDEEEDNKLSGEFENATLDLNEEASYVCNSCGEEIVVPIDFSQGRHQEYVEDCPVCCNPNVINVEVDEDGLTQVWSRSEQDPSS